MNIKQSIVEIKEGKAQLSCVMNLGGGQIIN